MNHLIECGCREYNNLNAIESYYEAEKYARSSCDLFPCELLTLANNITREKSTRAIILWSHNVKLFPEIMLSVLYEIFEIVPLITFIVSNQITIDDLNMIKMRAVELGVVAGVIETYKTVTVELSRYASVDNNYRNFLKDNLMPENFYYSLSVEASLGIAL